MPKVMIGGEEWETNEHVVRWEAATLRPVMKIAAWLPMTAELLDEFADARRRVQVGERGGDHEHCLNLWCQ